MTTHRFYSDKLIADHTTLELTAEQSHQIRNVLRLSVGDGITLFDGTGLEASAFISSLQENKISCRICQIASPKRGPEIELTVGLSLIRQQPFEFAVQKLTEIGVVEIVPIIAERCVSKMIDGRRWDRRQSRLRKIAVEAAEQSERTTIPSLSDPVTMEEFFRLPNCIALTERQDATLIGNVVLKPQLSVAVGPEGGWSPSELSIIAACGAVEVSLGSLILRSETAAIAAAATLIQRGNVKSQINSVLCKSRSNLARSKP